MSYRQPLRQRQTRQSSHGYPRGLHFRPWESLGCRDHALNARNRFAQRKTPQIRNGTFDAALCIRDDTADGAQQSVYCYLRHWIHQSGFRARFVSKSLPSLRVVPLQCRSSRRNSRLQMPVHRILEDYQYQATSILPRSHSRL